MKVCFSDSKNSACNAGDPGSVLVLSTPGKPTVELVGSDSNGLISFLNVGTSAVPLPR